MNDNQTRGGDDGGVIAISLPEFLNIFWRGRWWIVAVTLLGALAGVAYGLIVKPLYLGTVQVRPGIVTYNAAGDPIRGWALKDVVQWFETGRFWGGMKEQSEFADWTGAPIIHAEFIPIGLQFSPGGNIITLTHLSRDPANCDLVLQRAIDSFNSQAMADTNDTDIALALERGRLRIEDYRNDIRKLAGDEERARVDIATQQGELSLLEAEAQRIELERQRLEAQKTWRRNAIGIATTDLDSARSRLGQARRLLEVALESEELQGGGTGAGATTGDPVTTILLSSARREQAGRVVQLLDSIGRLEKYLFDGQVKVDTLNARIASIDLQLRDLGLEKEVGLAQKRRRVENQIQVLGIRLDRDIPHERTRLEHLLTEEEVKMSKLEALEQISPIQVTDRPVRPRKMRAVIILAGLAFFASLGLVLVREYFLRNRDAILAR